MIATFAPRVDGYYITDLPEVLLQRGDYIKHVNVMTGYVPQELSEDLGTNRYSQSFDKDHGID